MIQVIKLLCYHQLIFASGSWFVNITFQQQRIWFSTDQLIWVLCGWRTDLISAATLTAVNFYKTAMEESLCCMWYCKTGQIFAEMQGQESISPNGCPLSSVYLVMMMIWLCNDQYTTVIVLLGSAEICLHSLSVSWLKGKLKVKLLNIHVL